MGNTNTQRIRDLDPFTGELLGTEAIPLDPANGNTKKIPALTLALLMATLAEIVPGTRLVTTSGLATGGGPLSSDRAINVIAASDADAIAGTATDRAVTPHALAAALSSNTAIATLQTTVAALLASANPSVDTFIEVYNRFLSDESVAAANTTALANRVRFDAAQTLTGAQQTQALANVGAAAAVHGHAIADVTGLQTALNAKVATASAASLASVTTTGDATIGGKVAASYMDSATGSISLRVGGNNKLLCGDTTYGVIPGGDNALPLGRPDYRWSIAYLVGGYATSSDARIKTPVRSMSAAEIAAAQALSQEIGLYQMLDAVSAKGADGARMHVGMTVQRAIEIMTAHGLDPFRYGFICFDAWDTYEVTAAVPAIEEVRDEEGVVLSPGQPAVPTLIREAGSIYSFRYDELWGFIMAGLAAAQRSFEARLAALESRLVA